MQTQKKQKKNRANPYRFRGSSDTEIECDRETGLLIVGTNGRSVLPRRRVTFLARTTTVCSVTVAYSRCRRNQRFARSPPRRKPREAGPERFLRLPVTALSSRPHLTLELPLHTASLTENPTDLQSAHLLRFRFLPRFG